MTSGKSKNIVDIQECIDKSVEFKMKPFVQTTMMEHEQTRKRLDRAIKLMEMAATNRTHIIVQYFLMVIMGIVIITLNTCAFANK